jgi:hypothetical protein
MPSLSYPFSEHAEKLILAETVFKLYALSYTDPASEHTERVMLAEAVFDFYALAYAGDCSKV